MVSPTDFRPDPDALLAQLREEDLDVQRGKLRIYFGSSAGVGKTFAMLSAAQRAKRAGLDVLVGVVETHGRKETMELQADLKLLPLRKVPYRGQVLLELDIDAALAAKPDVLLVDELAHSNAPPQALAGRAGTAGRGYRRLDRAQCPASRKPQRHGRFHNRHSCQ
jgi:two-component system sensor histidine kinase KdpD